MHMLKKENLCRIRKIWQLHLKYFYKKYVQNLKYNVKRAYIFPWILVGIVCQKQGAGVGGSYLTDKTC